MFRSLAWLQRAVLSSALLAVAVLGAAPAMAQSEKILDTPTGWTYFYGATATTINNEIIAGRRPFTIQRVGANSYDVVTVQNSGSYAVPGFSTGNMHYNRTLSQLNGELNNRRLVSLDCYDVSGQTQMTAISVPNSGSGAVGWGWLVGQTRQQIIDWISNSSTPLRLLDLSIYTSGGQKRYSAVAVVNQGSQSQGWWYYFDKTITEVGQLLQQNNARLIDIELETAPSIISPARFACVMVAQNPGANWVYGSLSQSQVNETIGQTGGRLTGLHRYTNSTGNTRYAVSLVDNANAQTRRVRDSMASSVTTGSYGFMLKQVNGPVLASLHENFAFEPASTLKILHAAYAIRECALGNRTLDGDIWVPNRCTTQYWNDICPDIDYSCNSGLEPLSDTVRFMMRNSHNGRTRTLEDLFGRTTLNNFAAGPGGLVNTEINHHIGCGAPPNTTSSFDMVRFYERISNGTFFSAAWRNQLFGLMINLDEYGFTNSAFSLLNGIINQEAAGTDLTAAELADFRGSVNAAFKAGSYLHNGDYYRSVAGWTTLPFKVFGANGWMTVQRDYAQASFVHAGTDAGSTVAYSVRSEVMREQIREALETWDDACAPGIAGHPASVTVDEGEDAQFTAVSGGVGTPTYRWQRMNPGSGWFNLNDIAGVYQGVETGTLTLPAVTLDREGSYRCVITKICGALNTNAATLTVIPAGATSAPTVLPTHLVLHAPMPNPFNPQVTLRFELPRSTDHAVLEVFDVAGRRVRTLAAWSLPAGPHEFTWNGTSDAGRRVSSGVYLARLRAGGEQATHRLMLVE